MKPALIRSDWEGRTVDGKFVLLEWLGGSPDSGAFLTMRQGAQKAIIKLIALESIDAEAYLAQRQRAQSLSHPNLLRIHETGQTHIDGTQIFFVVTEFGEATLAQTIARRASDPDQTADILQPVLDALSYLHVNRFVHGNVKPSNILFVGGKVKLTSDDFLVAGDLSRRVRNPGHYDAPEALNGTITAAADIWSIGIILAETMTQRLPVWNWSRKGAPVIPESLPQPFYSIADRCLQIDPVQRCTLGQVQAKLGIEPGLRVATVSWPATPPPLPVAAVPKPVAAVPKPVPPPPPAPTTAVPSSPAATADVAPAEAAPRISAPRIPAPPPRAATRYPAPPPLASAPPPLAAPEPVVDTAPPPRAATRYPAPPPLTPAPPAPAAFEPIDTAPLRIAEVPVPHAPEPSVSPAFAMNSSSVAISRWEDPLLFESSGSTPLFAHYDSDDSRKIPFLPIAVVVLILLAFGTYIGVRSDRIKIPGLSQIQTAISGHQAAPQSADSSDSDAAPPPASAVANPSVSSPAQPAAQAASPSSVTPPASTAAQPVAPPPSTTAATSAPLASTSAPNAPAPESPQPVQASSAPNTSAVPAPSPADAAPAHPTPAPVQPTTSAVAPMPRILNARGAVASRVMPPVSRAAISSMRRPEEVVVRVSVDRRGSVEDVSYVSPGPGNYFARMAVRSAKEWKFNPPVSAGRPVASVWKLSFHFGRTGTDVSEVQVDR